MNKKNIFFILLLISLCINKVECSLYRDYYEWYAANGCNNQEISLPGACPEHFCSEMEYFFDCASGIDYRCVKQHYLIDWYLGLIPTIENTWCYFCGSKTIYPGYYDPFLNRYFQNFIDFLDFENNNDSPYYCDFWPEISDSPAKINNLAYTLFKDLLDTTEMSTIYKNGFYYDEDSGEGRNCLSKPNNNYEKFFRTLPSDSKYYETSSSEIYVITFVNHNFFYSHYRDVCRDIYEYSVRNFNEQQVDVIQKKLELILDDLAPLFLDLYTQSLEESPNSRIVIEKTIVEFDMGISNSKIDFSQDISNASVDSIKLTSHELLPIKSKNYKKKSTRENNFIYQPPSLPSYLSTYYLTQGCQLNDLLLYKEAIVCLSKASELDPNNRNIFIERALSYFETNQLELALGDYHKATKLSVYPGLKFGDIDFFSSVQLCNPKGNLEFSQGLLLGTIKGAGDSAMEFIPSIFTCCRGIFNGLWALVCSPIEVSQEMVYTAYTIGEFISTHSSEECLQCAVPELKELSLLWDKLNDHSKGQKIGYIIGKYGVDIFASIGILKGVNKARALKRANTMCTLECCANSQVKKAKILEESIKRASLRDVLAIESVKNGKILIKNSNVKYHVMQSKHAWNRVIELSGNIEEDFKKVVTFIENKNIINPKNLRNTMGFPKDTPIKNLHLLEYKATIEGQEVQVFLEKYVDTGETFLKNGWVITR